MNTPDRICIPISSQFRKLAAQVAGLQKNQYRKKLGLCAIAEYLRWQQYNVEHGFVDLALSDSVLITSVGQIGCVLVDSSTHLAPLEIDPDSHSNELGAILVELVESHSEARLLGFLPCSTWQSATQIHPISWSQVENLDAMIQYLDNQGAA